MFQNYLYLKVLKGASILLLTGVFLISCQKSSRPNVILFLVDDLGWKDLSSYGSTFYQTPNVDQLAKDGVLFTEAYATCTVCSPTRASILTGKYPARLNCTDWITGHEKPFARFLPPDWTQHIMAADTTVAEHLKSLGYKTIHIGKWHLGEEEVHWPKNHGFDVNIGGWKKGQPNRQKKEGGYFSPYFNPRLKDGPDGEYLTERLAKEAIDQIQSNGSQPFFLNFWLYNVHTPLQAREEKIQRYEALADTSNLQSNPTYAAMVEHMDEAIGKVIAELKAAEIYDNTIIIFASDNGGFLRNKGREEIRPKVTSNVPLRAGKGHKYEGGVRTPFLISWPSKIAGNRSSHVVTNSTDIYPTIIGLVDPNQLLPKDLDGQDLSRVLFEDAQSLNREAIFWHYPHYHTEGASPYSAIRSGKWKLIFHYENKRVELFNLDDDIGETKNVSGQYPVVANDLLKKLSDWKKEVGAQEPIPNPNYDEDKSGIWENKWSK